MFLEYKENPRTESFLGLTFVSKKVPPKNKYYDALLLLRDTKLKPRV